MKTIRKTILVLMLAGYGQGWGGFDEGLAAFVTKNYAEALAELSPLAEQGDVRAQCALGYMYKNGLGIPHDYQAALKWYRKAAEQGDSKSQNNLGLMYARGRGVPLDHVQAYMWYYIAGANGSEKGTRNRDRVAQNMSLAQIVKAQKLAEEWMEKHSQLTVESE